MSIELHIHRKELIEKINNILIENEFGTNEEMLSMSVNLEKSIYNKTINDAASKGIHAIWSNTDFLQLRHSLAINILLNLDPKSSIGSSFLVNELKNNKISCSDLCNMPATQLAPQISQPDRDKIKLQTAQKLKVNTTDIFECRKCKNRRCTYIERQTRGADELSGFDVECSICGNKWRE